MSGADPSVVRRLFDLAASAPPERRRAVLDRARAQHPLEVEEAEALLRHHRREQALLDASPLEALGLGGAEKPDSAEEALAAEYERLHGAFEPGSRVGPYRVLRTIGAGGRGVVYEARGADGRTVAVKIVRAELAGPAMIARFGDAALVARAAGLVHEGLVRVRGAGVLTMRGAPRPYLEMEIADGSAACDLARAGTLPVRARLEIAARACEAVEHAHRAGLVHGRLTSRDVLAEPRGVGTASAWTVKVLGFGEALLMGAGEGADAGADPLHAAGAFAAPELARGGAPTIVADVYALGAIFYELAAGRRPRGREGEAGARVPPPSAFEPACRGGIDPIALCALAPDPAHRYRAAAEMGADIRRLLDAPAGAPGSARGGGASARRARFWRLMLLATAAVGLGAAARWWWEVHTPRAASPRPTQQPAK